jgi:hypothetical protein
MNETTKANKGNSDLSPGEELQLRVYEKLWENIIHKENRLWTFLAIYGAAVGFIVSQELEKLGEFRYPAYIALLLLTYWAAEIIIDSDWWSIRNRVMVRGLEQKYATHLQGVVPTMYNSVGYRGESLHTASMAVVSIVGLVSYGVAVDVIFDANENLKRLWAVALYLFSVIAVVRCLHMRERRLHDYYYVFRDLNKQVPRVEEAVIAAQEKIDRGKVRWRLCALAMYGAIVGVMTWYAWELMSLPLCSTYTVAHIAIVNLFLCQYRPYKDVIPGCIAFGPETPKFPNGDRAQRSAFAYAYRNVAMLGLFWLTALVLALGVTA